MALKNYGVLKGKAVDTMTGTNEKPHFQVLIESDKGANSRLAINIKSQVYPSEVLYYVGEEFQSEEITKLPDLDVGFTAINDNHPDIGLDYIRGNLLDRAEMIPLPAEKYGPDNDLNEKIQYHFTEAMKMDAMIYAFGQNWGPEDKPDPYFHFQPGNGIHDIHMNQGNVGPWKKDNGTYQDGGILIHFEKENRWVAVFLAFQSQSWRTDDHGNAIKSVKECHHKSL